MVESKLFSKLVEEETFPNEDKKNEEKDEESKGSLGPKEPAINDLELDKPLHKRLSWDAVDPAILSKFDLMCKMGRGNYGTVWRAVDKRNRQRVAIKKINGAFSNLIDA